MTETIVTGGSPNELRRNSLGLIAVTFMVISGSVAMWLISLIADSMICGFPAAVVLILVLRHLVRTGPVSHRPA